MSDVYKYTMAILAQALASRRAHVLTRRSPLAAARMVKAIQRQRLPKGIYRVGGQDKFYVQCFFHLFGIKASGFRSTNAAKASLSGMMRVKSLLADHFQKVLLNGDPLLLECSVAAVKCIHICVLLMHMNLCNFPEYINIHISSFSNSLLTFASSLKSKSFLYKTIRFHAKHPT